MPDLNINDDWILKQRGNKNKVDPYLPYAYFSEPERTAGGIICETGTIFLTNRECPFHCLMCDLWKNTTDIPVPPGAIPAQIREGLAKLPPVNQLKLYNSGNFFDAKAIPPSDIPAIAALVSEFETIIVESHPRLVGDSCIRFRDLLAGELQVAIGLETVHPEVIKKLNKRMTLADFGKAVDFLNKNNIKSRAFILLRPPFLDETSGIEWAKKSIDFAFSSGVECCVIIPTRSGNGAMEKLAKQGLFHPPEIVSLEKVQEYGISLQRGRVFSDLWDLEKFSGCDLCYNARKTRLQGMNYEQVVLPEIPCLCH